MTLTARGLACARGSRRVLEGIDLSLSAGQALVLRGPNGCGKTTLLRTLAGLTPPAAGSLLIDPDHIAYSGHLDAVKGQMSVEENLAFWAGIYGSTLGDTLERFHLAPLAKRLAAHLSAGQKRRLGLARLAVTDRSIWLLDEPTTALDTEHVALVTETLNAHLGAGGIAVISTHLDLPVADADTLELSEFAPVETATNSADPFLEGTF